VKGFTQQPWQCFECNPSDSRHQSCGDALYGTSCTADIKAAYVETVTAQTSLLQCILEDVMPHVVRMSHNMEHNLIHGHFSDASNAGEHLCSALDRA
jgi:hypothetical protein